MKIYTKTGDKGETSLLSGERVKKNHIQIEVYGTIDELNSFVGLLSSYIENKELKAELELIQHKLFNAGTVFAIRKEVKFDVPYIKEEDIVFLENRMDQMNEELPELKNFILPGGNKTVSLSHVCRSICRRAERNAVSAEIENEKKEKVIQYLNRLSDYFFVLSRKLSYDTNSEIIIWKQ